MKSTPNPKINFKGIWEILKATATGFSDDKITKLSGSLAYYTVFSMGPLLVVIISLCGLFLKKEAVENRIYSILNDFVGNDTASQLQEIIKNVGTSGKGTMAAIISFVVLLIGSTTVFAEIQDSINGIWGLKPKPKKSWLKFLQNRFLSFSVIVGLGFILLVSLAITGLIETLGTSLKEKFPDVAVIVFYVFNLLLTLFISSLIFAVIFKVLPDAKIRWRDVFAGAIVTALLFILGKFAISFYISRTNVGSTYGAAGSIVVLLVWVYYSSIILYVGAEFTKAYAVKYGAAIHPSEYAVTMKEVIVETGKQPVNL